MTNEELDKRFQEIKDLLQLAFDQKEELVQENKRIKDELIKSQLQGSKFLDSWGDLRKELDAISWCWCKDELPDVMDYYQTKRSSYSAHSNDWLRFKDGKWIDQFYNEVNDVVQWRKRAEPLWEVE